MKKRTNNQQRDKIQEVLERHKRFDYDYIPYGKNWYYPDETYRYRPNALDKVIRAFWRGFLFIFAPILTFICYGARVKGKKNLKAVKNRGAISVCNHISYLDTLFVRQAVGQIRSFHTMAAFNNKRGLGGHIIRHGGMLPFSNNLKAMKNLENEMERLLNKGKIINFYAEKAMWVNYPKPRPLQTGAFHYAVKYDVPVVPIFCTFKKNRFGHMKKLRIHVLPPIFPDKGLGKKQRAADMLERTQNSWKQCYETTYGIPLEYLPKN